MRTRAYESVTRLELGMVKRINSYLGIMRFADARDHKFRSIHVCVLLLGGLRLLENQQRILPIFLLGQ